ncbi:unnamed protein product [Tilletia controversa]|uniref:Uncharacterized protein n=4 Tax=Tilletia TaxID=13289 RepID=A0A8X7MID5_9BASI|nr:hypothetical protein A4X06_0g9474 [Tilletia controversa]CAD6968083.1 unnamed protein product [Tilletia controversa]
MNGAVFWDFLSAALMVLLPLFLRKLFAISDVWPNHLKPTAFKITQAEGSTRMRTIVLSREQVRALKAAASTNARTGRCTLHATINESMKVAVIAADRAHERAVQQKVAWPLPSRLNYHFASQNPIDMRTGDDSRSYGRFAGNHFGMKVMPVSNRTDVHFWAEAVGFNSSIGSPATKRTAAATLSVLGFIPSKEGWVNEDGVGPELFTGWEHYFYHCSKGAAKFTGTCNYSNLGLVAQPRAGAGSVLPLAKGLPAGAINPDSSELAILVRPSLITENSMGNLSDIFPIPTKPSDSLFKQPRLMGTAISATAMGKLLPPSSFTTAAAELETLDTVKDHSRNSSNGNGLEGDSIVSNNMSASDSAEFACGSGAQAFASPSNSSFNAGSSTLVHTPNITASNTMTQNDVKAFARFAPHPTSDADQALPTFLVDQVFFIQTVQPGSCAFYVDVVGCAVAPLTTMTSDGQGHDGAAAAGGAVTISVTWIEGHLPEPCAETFMAALRSGLALCASGGIGPETTVGQAVEEVERIVGQV